MHKPAPFDNQPHASALEKYRLWWLFLPLAFWICVVDWAPLELQLRYPQLGLEKEFRDYLNGVIDGTLGGPYHYRLLAPYIVYGLNQVIPWVDALWIDITLKFVVLAAIQKLAFDYFRNFVSPMMALPGVVWLDLLLVFSLNHVIGVSLIESMDLLNLLFILIGLVLVYQRRHRWLLLLLPIAMLNRETPWIILPLVILVDWREAQRFRLRWLWILLALVIPYLGLRLLMPGGPSQWMTFKVIPFNIPFLYLQHTPEALLSNLKLLLLIGPLGYLNWHGRKHLTGFLLACALVGVLFIVIHYGVGIIREWRLWMPLFLLWMPAALLTLSRLLKKDSLPESRLS